MRQDRARELLPDLAMGLVPGPEAAEVSSRIADAPLLRAELGVYVEAAAALAMAAAVVPQVLADGEAVVTPDHETVRRIRLAVLERLGFAADPGDVSSALALSPAEGTEGEDGPGEDDASWQRGHVIELPAEEETREAVPVAEPGATDEAPTLDPDAVLDNLAELFSGEARDGDASAAAPLEDDVPGPESVAAEAVLELAEPAIEEAPAPPELPVEDEPGAAVVEVALEDADAELREPQDDGTVETDFPGALLAEAAPPVPADAIAAADEPGDAPGTRMAEAPADVAPGALDGSAEMAIALLEGEDTDIEAPPAPRRRGLGRIFGRGKAPAAEPAVEEDDDFSTEAFDDLGLPAEPSQAPVALAEVPVAPAQDAAPPAEALALEEMEDLFEDLLRTSAAPAQLDLDAPGFAVALEDIPEADPPVEETQPEPRRRWLRERLRREQAPPEPADDASDAFDVVELPARAPATEPEAIAPAPEEAVAVVVPVAAPAAVPVPASVDDLGLGGYDEAESFDDEEDEDEPSRVGSGWRTWAVIFGLTTVALAGLLVAGFMVLLDTRDESQLFEAQLSVAAAQVAIKGEGIQGIAYVDTAARRGLLQVDGLKPLPRGRQLAIWAEDSNGEVTRIRVFGPTRESRQYVELTRLPKDLKRLFITDEATSTNTVVAGQTPAPTPTLAPGVTPTPRPTPKPEGTEIASGAYPVFSR